MLTEDDMANEFPVPRRDPKLRSTIEEHEIHCLRIGAVYAEAEAAGFDDRNRYYAWYKASLDALADRDRAAAVKIGRAVVRRLCRLVAAERAGAVVGRLAALPTLSSEYP